MVDAESVHWAFRLFLCREAEEGIVPIHQARNKTYQELRETFFNSPEFQNYLTQKGYSYQRQLIRCADKYERPFYLDEQFLPSIETFVLCRYQPEASEQLQNALSSGSVLIDIGASVGWFSLLASEIVGESGHVFAFEPHMSTYEALKRTVALRDKSRIVSCVRAALGDRNSFARLSCPSIPDARGARLDDSRGFERVPLCSLDTYSVAKRVSVIKINTNGSELSVVKGARDLIGKDRPILFVPQRAAKEIMFLLKDFDYRQRDAADDDDDLLVMLEPKEPSGSELLLGRMANALKGSAASPHRGLSYRISRFRKRKALEKLVGRSGWFDPVWYLAQNPDVKAKNVDPLRHFCEHGDREGRNPGPSFDSRSYLLRFPDVAASGMGALEHYLRFGQGKGLDRRP